MIRIGCSGVPTGLRRERYFEKLGYLECPETFASPPRAKVMRGWREGAPEDARFGLLASRVISHDPGRAGFEEIDPGEHAQAGGFRDTPVVRAAVDRVLEQVQLVGAEIVVFRSPTDLSPSAGDRLRAFFGEIATAERFGAVHRAWEPGDLWQTEPALRLCEELDLVPVLDPLAEDALGGGRPRPFERLGDDQPVYLRVRAIGRARDKVPGAELDELADRLRDREGEAWVVFANHDKNRDAQTLTGLLED